MKGKDIIHFFLYQLKLYCKNPIKFREQRGISLPELEFWVEYGVQLVHLSSVIWPISSSSPLIACQPLFLFWRLNQSIIFPETHTMMNLAGFDSALFWAASSGCLSDFRILTLLQLYSPAVVWEASPGSCTAVAREEVYLSN